MNIRRPNGMKTIQVMPETTNIVLPSASARAADTKQLFKGQIGGIPDDDKQVDGALASEASDYQCTEQKRPSR